MFKNGAVAQVLNYPFSWPWQAAGVQIQVKVCKLHMEVPDVMLQIPTSKRSRGDLWG